MYRTYYVGEGPEAKAVIDAAWVKVKAFRDAGYALTEGMPEDTMICSRNGGIGRVCGFGFTQKLSADELDALGLVPDVQRATPDGTFIPTYVPNKRTKKGKELRDRMELVNRKHVTFSSLVVSALKIDREVIDGRALHHSVAGCSAGKLFVSIPGAPGDDNDREREGERFPDVPAWFREMKVSEWLAAQGK